MMCIYVYTFIYIYLLLFIIFNNFPFYFIISELVKKVLLHYLLIGCKTNKEIIKLSIHNDSFHGTHGKKKLSVYM